MQFFFYNSSLAFEGNTKKDEAVNFLRFLKNIVDNVVPKLLEHDL